MSNERELPKYRCHKEVHALKIKGIERGEYRPPIDEFDWIITPEEEGYEPFRVLDSYMQRHHPQVGGYYVVYEDGYLSYSPPEAFDNGYTRI